MKDYILIAVCACIVVFCMVKKDEEKAKAKELKEALERMKRDSMQADTMSLEAVKGVFRD